MAKEMTMQEMQEMLAQLKAQNDALLAKEKKRALSSQISNATRACYVDYAKRDGYQPTDEEIEAKRKALYDSK